MTLPRMSSEATPGYPAPLTACIVVTKIDSMPNFSCSGASATTSPMAEHRATRGGKLRLQLASNACVQGSENHARRAFRRGVGHLHLAHTFRDGCLQPPAYCVAVGLPS